MAGLSADLVITGGKVITVNPRNETVEALAILGDKIVAVGTAKEIASCIGPNTEVIDLKGRTVLPGFNDPHVHFMNYGIRSTYVNCRTPPNKNIAEVLERIRQRAAETPKGEWILAQGVDERNLEERRFPTRQELDSAAPDHPLYITARVKHAIVVNSMALQRVGYDESTPQPAGGHLDKDAQGRLTGVLREKAAFSPVDRIIPPATVEKKKQGLARVSKLFASVGITSGGEAGADGDPETNRAYHEAFNEGLVKTRTYVMIHDKPYHDDFYLKNDLGFRTGFGNEWLRLGSMKTCTDGSYYVRTCAYYEPYVKLETENQKASPRGVLQYSGSHLNEMVLDAHRKGYQVAIHAQGDYGCDVAIDAMQYALWKYPRADHRHRIEHAQSLTPEARKRMKKLGIIANFMPGLIWYWGDWYAADLLGKERTSKLSSVRSAIDAGLVTMLHSDAPVFEVGEPAASCDPLFIMWCTVNRMTSGGQVMGPEERIAPMDAIRAYTINPAFATFEEKIKGSIEPGKLADLVILSDNPCAVDPLDIRKIKVERTIVGGTTIFQAT